MPLAVDNSILEMVFMNKAFLFGVFGIMLLLYVVAVIYNRIKRPKNKTIVKVHAKVLSVNQARAQTNHRDVGFDGLISGGAAIPGARFDATFIAEESEETYVFSISESISNQLSVGKAGVLCFNGDEFISFGKDKEIEKIKKYYSFRRKFVFLAILGVLLIGAGIWAIKYFWGNKPEDLIVEELVDRPLTVYMSAHITNQDNPDEMITSRYNLGDFGSLLERWGEEHHIYYDAIKDYKNETGREVDVVFFGSTSEMLDQAHEEWKKGCGPDVVIGDNTDYAYVLHSYIKEGMFEDLMPYFEEDEIYSSDEYVTEVLEGGRIGEAQLIFPLTFNMNMLFTSEERMREYGITLVDDMTYWEVLELFQNEWNADREDEYLLVQFTQLQGNDFPIVLFMSASGSKVIDYETSKIVLDYEEFEAWAHLYESYVCNEYQMNRQEIKNFAYQNQDIYIPVEESKLEMLRKLTIKQGAYNVFELTKEKVYCWAEGGSQGGFYHPFAVNTKYYESRATDDNEEFVLYAIPSVKSSNEYAAEIINFGAVLADGKRTEEAYEFVKAMADNEHWMHFDLSVNRKRIEQTLDDLSGSKYKLNLAIAEAPPIEMPEADIPNMEAEGYEANNWYGDEGYMMNPLSEESKQYLISMINHIGTANLPEFSLEKIMIDEIGEYIWGDTDTIEEAYDNTIKQFVERGYIE
ncbi:MAG: extracellular solute-binding protein [Firmicutes bacterium]|nr:extracellular solute-binding protein [Bacillota bacterium]